MPRARGATAESAPQAALLSDPADLPAAADVLFAEALPQWYVRVSSVFHGTMLAQVALRMLVARVASERAAQVRKRRRPGGASPLDSAGCATAAFEMAARALHSEPSMVAAFGLGLAEHARGRRMPPELFGSDTRAARAAFLKGLRLYGREADAAPFFDLSSARDREELAVVLAARPLDGAALRSAPYRIDGGL